jgi:hypothetical protein
MRFDNLTQDRIKTRHKLVAHHLGWHAQISRRSFLEGTLGASVIGGTVGLGLRPASAWAGPGVGNVLPIPTTLTNFGVDIHVQAPPFTGVDTDPATVWNFQGSSGIAFINTTATQTHRQTGIVQEGLDSSFNHMTFLQGVYRGGDGHVREGTFYDPQLGGAQIHDFNPGIRQNGLFWTAFLPAGNVQVDLHAGTATLEAHDLHMKDYGDIENAITGDGDPPVPAVVSFKV